MSRSWKKTPILKYGGIPGGKGMANRKVRRMKFLGLRKGNLYKKAYPQYDVNDYVLYLPKERVQRHLSKNIEIWEKYYRRK